MKFARLFLIAVLPFAVSVASAQSSKFAQINGVAVSAQSGEPMGYAVVQLSPAEIFTTTNAKGEYSFERVTPGKVSVSIEYIGMETLTRELEVSAGQKYKVDFAMNALSFRMEAVTVVATGAAAGKATASNISRQAMDHMQMSSLGDAMSLIPGMAVSNPSLNASQTITLRTTGGSDNSLAMNSLGTAIIVDGAPVSNNANMQVLSPTVDPVSMENRLGGSSPNMGVDVRTISTDNIESIEVIRGIPSVEYGDMTSGAVVVKSKAGVTPLTIRFKTNPNIYQVSAAKGLSLGEGGDLNLSADYAYNINSLVASYKYYQRANLKGLWTKNFGSNINTNTSIDFTYGKDTQDYNPDAASYRQASGATNLGARLASNGYYNVNLGWLQSINYTISGSYTDRRSFLEEGVSNALSLYTTAMGNSTVTNRPGVILLDKDGNQITSYAEGDEDKSAIILPYSYFSHYDIYGKEINAYAKVVANFFAKFGDHINNRIILGADYKTDGNLGRGVVFPADTPPRRAGNSSGFRQRAFSDIPFINQLGLFAEDSWLQSFGERNLNVVAGLRYDWVNGLSSLAPRINASFDVIPRALTLRAGWGITSKAPTAVYLYPQNAYYDATNFNNTLNTPAPTDDEKLIVATTKVFDVTNPDLEIARNRKAEVGFDLTVANRYRLSVTAYDEFMNNGYNIGTDISCWNLCRMPLYKVASQEAGQPPVLYEDVAPNIFFQYYKPLNNTVVTNRGVEYELDLGRFDDIRTSFNINGAWSQTKASNKGYTFGDNSNAGTSERNIAIYEPYLRTYCSEQMITTLRATHNIPSLGFVVTLTGQISWYEKSWTEFRDDEMFIKYISRVDGQVYDFDPALKDDPEYAYMFTTRKSTRFLVELTQPYVLFNLNVTKEIGDLLTASFYVNNIFNNRPIYELKTSKGEITELGIPIFFGFDVKITIR